MRGDISDGEAVTKALDDHGITHVIHLAALLIPSIKANPPYGTAVNIGGTVNVLDLQTLAANYRKSGPTDWK